MKNLKFLAIAMLVVLGGTVTNVEACGKHRHLRTTGGGLKKGKFKKVTTKCVWDKGYPKKKAVAPAPVPVAAASTLYNGLFEDMPVAFSNGARQTIEGQDDTSAFITIPAGVTSVVVGPDENDTIDGRTVTYPVQPTGAQYSVTSDKDGALTVIKVS